MLILILTDKYSERDMKKRYKATEHLDVERLKPSLD